MPKMCFSYDTQPGLHSPAKMGVLNCFSYPADLRRMTGTACFSYSADALLGVRDPEAAQSASSGLLHCFRY
jgi:hypothetical protein